MYRNNVFFAYVRIRGTCEFENLNFENGREKPAHTSRLLCSGLARPDCIMVWSVTRVDEVFVSKRQTSEWTWTSGRIPTWKATPTHRV
jgi:hypothetical protein